MHTDEKRLNVRCSSVANPSDPRSSAFVRSSIASGSSGKLRFDLGELFGDGLVGVDALFHRADRVEDGGVIAATEVAAGLFQRVAGVLARQEHADLAGEGDGFVALLALEVGGADVVVLGDDVEDLLDGDAALLGAAGV